MSGFCFKKKEYSSILVITLAYICSQTSSNVFKAPENKGHGGGRGEWGAERVEIATGLYCF